MYTTEVSSLYKITCNFSFILTIFIQINKTLLSYIFNKINLIKMNFYEKVVNELGILFIFNEVD